MEWKDQYNSFNSWKGLMYTEHYKAISAWIRGVGNPLPPIEVSLDPVHACNLMCAHCNAGRYLDSMSRMDDKHLIRLVSFLGEWGCKAICFGGGGEPTMHSKLSDAIITTSESGMESSVATNGTLFSDVLIDTLASNCRWVGVSVDAATAKTYEVGRRANLYRRVIDNIKKLSDKCRSLKSRCDVAFKFLIFDYNQHEIYEACKIAKELGVRDFHARPADFRHQGMNEFQKKTSLYNVELIKDQLEKCHNLEDSTFRVFTVTHKFNDDFTPRRKFSQCYAAPICIQLCADGGIYFCPDTRHSEFYKLGNHYPDEQIIKKVWGSDSHKELVSKCGCKNCDSRCTFSPYNEQCERLFINQDDPMCRNFV